MANQDIIYNWGLTSRALPSSSSDNAYAPMRLTRRGEVFTQPLPFERQALALEATYFMAHNAINDAATTLAGHAAPVLADADSTMTKPFWFMRVPAGTTTLVLPDFLEIEVITAGANGTADSWAAQLDTGTTRLSSGGTALTLVNPNMQSSVASVFAASSSLLAGAPVVGAESSSVRDLGFGQFRPTIQIAGDKYLFLFGRQSRQGEGIATIAHHVVDLGPVVLGATDQLLVALYSPSQSAAGVYKVRAGWVER